MSDTNIWSDEWGEQPEDWSGGGGRSKRLPRGAERPGLGLTVYEFDPGNFVVYHFHHAFEELLVVLRGRPTLRTPSGERQLDEGEAVYFPPGPDGTHGLKNETDEPVRVLMASTLSSPEVAEYPDLRQITAQARTGSMTGERLWLIHDVDPKGEVEA
ncbi:MAG: cupin domain-containing protein [Actinobacteria bacterium]|nr:MAG: cupin domain-containing protein [Actinomycetota bacterium]